MEAALQDLLSALVIALITVAIYFIRLGVNKAITYFNVKIGESNTVMLKDMAVTIVKALQQSPAFESLGGEQKKELAIIQMSQWAGKHNLPFDHDYIDRLIEEAVLTMKTEMGK